MTAQAFDDLLFVLSLIEALVCGASAYVVVVVVGSGYRQPLATPLGIFGGAAIGLLLTAALADMYHAHQRRSGQGGPPREG